MFKADEVEKAGGLRCDIYRKKNCPPCFQWDGSRFSLVKGNQSGRVFARSCRPHTIKDPQSRYKTSAGGP
jgi:hypothetical protein